MNVLTIFSGAGGADIGLRDAGLQHVLGVELDPVAARSARLGGFHVLTDDVRTYDWQGVARRERVDLVWASPPCQDWSTAGNRLGADGERNGWPWTLDVLDAVRPAWLLAENVPGMLSGSARSYTRALLSELRRRFAWAEARVLDAADFGVPQRRRRVIFAAGPHPLQWPDPTHSGEALAVAKWRTGSYWRELGVDTVGKPSRAEARWLEQYDAEQAQVGLFGQALPDRYGLRPWRTVRQALGLGGMLGGMRNTENHPTQERPAPTDEPSPTVGGGGNLIWQLHTNQTTGNGSKRGPRRHVVGVDRPAPTVRAQDGTGHQLTWSEDPKHPTVCLEQPCTTLRSGGDGHAAPPTWVRLDSGRRRLTPEECAALQGFPPGYRFAGTKTSIYKQIGNAVPPPLAQALGEAVQRALF